MKNNPLFALATLLLLINSVEAARVGVVIDLQNQTYTKCVTVSDNANAYEIIQETSLDIAWSYYGGSLGHGLCGINELGCPDTNCYCDANKYWGFYVKAQDDGLWSYSQTGFDGGTSCSEHYCAQDGDMIGLAYGEYGTKPTDYEYSAICNAKNSKKENIYAFSLEPQNPETGDTVSLNVFDNETKEGIKRIETALYYKDSKVLSGITDSNGTIFFSVNKTGQYTLKLNVVGYEAPHKTIKIDVAQKTTTTTSTTTSTTTTTQETTTTTSTTTTTTSSTTTTTATETTSTNGPSKSPVIGEVTGAQPENNTAGLILVAVLFAAAFGYAGYRTYKKRKP